MFLGTCPQKTKEHKVQRLVFLCLLRAAPSPIKQEDILQHKPFLKFYDQPCIGIKHRIAI